MVLHIALASSSPLAPIVWVGIVSAVVGIGVWHHANAAGQPTRQRIKQVKAPVRKRD